jgi:hypothetical protein
LAFQVGKHGPGNFVVEPTFEQIADDKILASAHWLEGPPSGPRQQRYEVLTIRDGKIADMQTCGSRRQALRFARRAI